MAEVLLGLQAAVVAYNLLSQIITSLQAGGQQFTPEQRAAITEARHKAVEAMLAHSVLVERHVRAGGVLSAGETEQVASIRAIAEAHDLLV
jgi:ABC-type branched-subunit amino acid transport system ATPase component